MTTNDVNTLLFLCSPPDDISNSFLFHCALYWAGQGNRVTYISQTPVTTLPPAINKTDTPNPEIFSQIRFMYFTRWQDLLQQIYSIHQQHNPPSVIIVHHLEYYCKSEHGDETYDHTSLICASLLYAARICAHRTGKTSTLISDYHASESLLPRTIYKNFFNDLWHMKTLSCETDKRQLVQLSKLIPFTKVNEPIMFTFAMDFDNFLLKMQQIFTKTAEKFG